MLDRMFSNQFPPLVFLRRLGLWFLRSVPVLKTFMLKLMIGLKGKTPELAKR